MRQGVILAGGRGTRLYPITKVVNKHLLPVWNKPMILYPIETLKKMGITDILIITGGEHLGTFLDFLGDGSDFGVNFTYKVQKESGGIAQALFLAKDFVKGQFAVILGDNIFQDTIEPTNENCAIVLTEVEDGTRFGVFYDGKIIEKPKEPLSNMAVTGLYFYTPEIFNFINIQHPSTRGELEITDVNNWCLENLPTEILTYKGFWSDAGTFDSLLSSSNFIKNNE